MHMNRFTAALMRIGGIMLILPIIALSSCKKKAEPAAGPEKRAPSVFRTARSR